MRTDLNEYITTPDEMAETPPPPTAKPLGQLVRHADHDPSELLRTRYLCKGGGLLLIGRTGIGKSSLVMQLSLSWALNRACFGIEPARALKTLVIQAENDDGDLAEMRDGVAAGMDLDTQERDVAFAAVIVAKEARRTGPSFWAEVVEPLLAEHHPDILVIDPALSYLGGNASAQEVVGPFLRNGLGPLLDKYECAAIIVSHTNKPASGKEKPTWQAGDFAYLGTGSAEWANWPRAVLGIRSVGSHEVFQLEAGKRGSRLGWRDATGDPVYSRSIAHAREPGRIYWREAEDEEVPKPGAPVKGGTVDDVWELLGNSGLTNSEWEKAAEDLLFMKERTFQNRVADLRKAKRVNKSRATGKWIQVTR